jgi:purine-nucleoside phosphorylase
MTDKPSQRLERARKSIEGRSGAPADVGVMLGSGLNHLAEAVVDPAIVPYGEIDGFPISTAPGHMGRLVIGTLFGRRVVVMQGRLHLFEGWKPADIALPVHLLKSLGVATLVVTNAAGGLNSDYDPGDVMLIADHLNLTGLNPLTGPNDDSIGLRFPDMSRAYDPDLLKLVETAASRAGVAVRKGVYAGIGGPSLETSAERRFLRMAGGDAVGMSTVTEVVAAVHAGLRVIGMSGITNVATGGPEQQPDTVEDIFAHARVCGAKMEAILRELLPTLPVAKG